MIQSLVICSFILFSCKINQPHKEDPLLGLIKVHQDEQLYNLVQTFGEPTRIEKTQVSKIEKYVYENQSLNFITWVDITNKKVLNSVYFLWKTNDDYEYLKRMLGKYEWLEKHKPSSPHPTRKLIEVSIPKAGISFEYDRIAPKIFEIYLSKPKIIEN